MRRLALMMLLLGLCLTTAQSQEQHRSWLDVYNELTTADDAESTLWEENHDLLEQLAAHPLNLNKATREDLEQLPFLTEQQVMDLQEYLSRYGPMRSLGELRMVRSMDYRQLQLLPFFVYVSHEQEAPRDTLPSLQSIARYAQHELSAYAQIPFYERKGDHNGYLGYRYKHWLRYEMSYHDRLRIGLIGAQDAGEPFLANRNTWGYDYYSYYLQISKIGRMKTLVLGKYRLSTGMGLVLNNSFSLGKLFMLQSLGRSMRSLRPHTSRSEADYFQGAAATIALSKRLDLTTYVSYRPIDATLDKGSATASTLLTSGYHRTPTEMQKKYNTHMTDAGASVLYRTGALKMGITAVYTHLDRSLEPNRKTLYRRYYAHGTNFFNLSADYALTLPRLSLAGETAINADGALATVNVASYQPSSRIGLVAAQRFFSYRYHALRGNSFCEGGHVQNESSLYVGATWQPAKYVHLQAYTDWAYFPWARYQASASSYANDHLLGISYQRQQVTITARYRLHLRQRDDENDHLEWRTEHRARLQADYNPTENLTLRTQADASRTVQQDASQGIMLSEHVSYKSQRFSMWLSAAWFKTDDYDSRLYLFEHALPRTFSVPAFYGEGIRLSATAQLRLNSHLQAGVRFGLTRYFDRETIGSGLQQIDGTTKSDLELSLRWKLRD